jgi:AcrR family transcriptional regulator
MVLTLGGCMPGTSFEAVASFLYGSVWKQGMPVTRTPPSRWIDAGLRALGAGGPDAVRIEPLARELGVTKGGFYWHFDGRGALLEELLDAWERVGVTEVIERVDAEGGDARAKLRRLSAIAVSGERELGIDPLRVDLAVRDWARRDKRVARRLRRVDNRRMDYMRSLFGEFCSDEEDVEARSLLSFALWIGNHFIAADHGGLSRDEAQDLAFNRLLERS